MGGLCYDGLMNRTWSMVAGISGVAFLVLALVQLYLPGLARGIDISVTELIAPYQTLEWIQGFLAVTALGDVATIIAIAIGGAVLLRHHPSLIQRLTIALIGSTVSTNVVKALVSRARPETLLWLNPFLSFSFPSGHATASMALFGFFMVVAVRLLPPGIARKLTILTCAIAIVLVGMSRLVIGAHFFSDVMGGWLLGIFWIALAFSIKRDT